VKYFSNTWPKALQKLKEIAEAKDPGMSGLNEPVCYSI
jgi:hypothetical protein